MARVRMVTRTINITEVNTITMDISDMSTSILKFTLTGENYTTETALKAVKKLYETKTLKVVAVQSLNLIEEVYGMSEIEFLKVAQKLDPATRKALETAE